LLTLCGQRWCKAGWYSVKGQLIAEKLQILLEQLRQYYATYTGGRFGAVFSRGRFMKKFFCGTAVLALVAGCATPYQPTPFDRTATGVNKIAIVENALPEEVGTQKLATNGQNMASAMGAQLGLAGVLVGAAIAGVEAGIEAGQRTKIRAALATQNFNGEAIFDAALEGGLREQNFALSTVSIPREKNRAKLTIANNPASEAGQAVLDVNALNYGYQLVGGGTQWRPFVVIDVRLLDAKDTTKVLMDNQVVYNPVARPTVTVNIPPDEKYSFAKIEDLEADPVKAAEGLKIALEAAAKATANLLR
jgi:hypothetical protein